MSAQREEDLVEESISLPSIEQIESLIILLRGRKVIIDADLARLYGVTTSALNQAVRRNAQRFPPDFAFIVTESEKSELITNCDRFKMMKHSTALPTAFTEFGATMAANVLNSDEAVQTSVFIVRAFFKMRDMLSTGLEMGQKLSEFERRLDGHDDSIRDIVAAIRGLTLAAPKPARKIGFKADGDAETEGAGAVNTPR
jgi:hypothetical protein